MLPQSQIQVLRALLLGALSIASGCRASGNDADVADAAASSGNPSIPASDEDAGFEPTRSEPPVIHPFANVMVETLAGSSTPGATDGVGAGASFSNPVGVLLEPSGSVLVTEYDGGRLRRVDASGATTTLVNGLAEPFGLIANGDAIYVQTDRDEAGKKGPSTGTLWRIVPGAPPGIVVSGLGNPRGLAFLKDGRLLIADRIRHVLSVVDFASFSVARLAGSGSPGFTQGRGRSAAFNEPYGVAVLPDGSAVVADHKNDCIRRVSLEGDVTIFAGDGNPGMKDDDDKFKARFDRPIDVATDALGDVYVSDGGNHRIRRISASGVVETVAGNGTLGFADGIGLEAKFYGQEQLDVSPDGKTIYVSDGNGGNDMTFHRVRRVQLP